MTVIRTVISRNVGAGNHKLVSTPANVLRILRRFYLGRGRFYRLASRQSQDQKDWLKTRGMQTIHFKAWDHNADWLMRRPHKRWTF